MRSGKPEGSRRRKHNSRRPRFVVGGMDAQTANDHILAEGLIDDDTLAQLGETTFTMAPSPPAQIPGATAAP